MLPFWEQEVTIRVPTVPIEGTMPMAYYFLVQTVVETPTYLRAANAVYEGTR